MKATSGLHKARRLMPRQRELIAEAIPAQNPTKYLTGPRPPVLAARAMRPWIVASKIRVSTRAIARPWDPTIFVALCPSADALQSKLVTLRITLQAQRVASLRALLRKATIAQQVATALPASHASLALVAHTAPRRVKPARAQALAIACNLPMRRRPFPMRKCAPLPAASWPLQVFADRTIAPTGKTSRKLTVSNPAARLNTATAVSRPVHKGLSVYSAVASTRA